MKNRLIIILLCVPLLCVAQSTTQNYVKETSYLDSLGSNITNVSYFDGLGNLVETASTGSGTSNTIYSFATYDSKGRERVSYYPTPIGSGLDFKEGEEFMAASQAYYGDAYAFGQKSYDYSDRVVREDIAGKAWHDHGAHNASSYDVNTADDKVIRYSESLAKSYYPAGCLEKETVVDADGHEVISFKDLGGNVILERRNQGDTYYIYNSLGQLTYVLSPMYQENEDLAAFAYQYVYDNHDNLVRKKLPGAENVEYWYDKEDHLVFEQDGQLRAKGLYRFYLYDSLGRIVVVGKSHGCNTHVQNVEVRVSYTSSEGFLSTNYVFSPSNIANIIDTSDATIEKVYYYDRYDFLSRSHQSDFESINPSPKTGVNGLLAGSIVGTSNGQFVFSVYCYDPKGNLTHTLTKGLEGYGSEMTSTYSLTDKPISTEVKVDVRYGDKLSILISNSYSNRNGMLASKTISLEHGGRSYFANMSYEYDALNRLSKIIRPEKAGNVSYAYDVHGWPTKIESKNFQENLSYADGMGTPCYNGNISVLQWKNSTYYCPRGYKFTYDVNNRMTNALYCEGNELERPVGRFNEFVGYDLNGNITSLQREGYRDGGYGIIDDLSISLTGNQVTHVTDAAEENISEGSLDFNGESSYRYNTFGALESDSGRGITRIDYDDNQNPVRIQFSNGNVTKYVYSAEGEKLRTIYYTAMPNISVADGNVHELTTAETLAVDSVDYLLGGNLILKNGRIERYLFEGGYCEAQEYWECIVKPFPGGFWDEESANSESPIKQQSQMADREKTLAVLDNYEDFIFYYYTKDHIGNNREVVDMQGNIDQVTNYYPYGTPYGDPTTTTYASFQPFKYNGKEFDMMHGLNTYDYGARQYNPIVPTWDRMDNLCEQQAFISPYNYCLCNPINAFDSDGNVAQWAVGAVMGFGVDYGGQVLANFFSEKSAYDIFYGEVNFSSVATSTAEGALTCGGSAVRKGFVVAGSILVNNAVEVTGNNGFSYEKNPAKYVKNVTIDAVTMGAGHYAKQETKRVVQNFAPKKYNPQKKNNLSSKTKKKQRKREKERNKKIDEFDKKTEKYVPPIVDTIVNSITNGVKRVIDKIFSW